MEEQAPDKSDEQKQDESSVVERDTSDISVDLIDYDTVASDVDNIISKARENLLETVKKEQEDELTDALDSLGENENAEGDNTADEDAVEEIIVPMEDPYEKATKYLAKHNVIGLFQNITADIAYKKPTDPIQFMIDEIEKLQEMDRRRKGVILRKNPETKSLGNGASTQTHNEINLTDS